MKRFHVLCTVLLVLLFTGICSPVCAEENEGGNKDSGDHLMQDLGHDFSIIGGDVTNSFSQILNNLSLETKANNHLIKVIYAILIIIATVIGFIIVFVIVQTVRNTRVQKLQQQQFETVLSLIHKMQTGENKKALPNDDLFNQQEMHDLAEQCEALGAKIDIHTNRKNNSKNVSELVFKISERLGIDQNTATVYFFAAMVYDAGFLSIKSELFMVDILSTQERTRLKRHVDEAIYYFDFVPKKYLQIFTEAATMHHENMNGSGYPEGLQGDDIPQIARLIHVVESYVSLVNSRSYHKILDKKSAIAELRRQPGIYDTKIIDALEKIV